MSLSLESGSFGDNQNFVPCGFEFKIGSRQPRTGRSNFTKLTETRLEESTDWTSASGSREKRTGRQIQASISRDDKLASQHNWFALQQSAESASLNPGEISKLTSDSPPSELAICISPAGGKASTADRDERKMLSV